MTSKINIRVAKIDDLDSLVEFSHGLFLTDGGKHDPQLYVDWPVVYGHDYYEPLIGQYRYCFLIAEEQELAVGYLLGYLKEKNSVRPIQLAELESIFVKAEYRNSGAGSQLVAHFMTWCKERNVDRIKVNAYAANEGAIRFYERHGFAPRSTSMEVGLR